jgi:hypothetical protein
MPRKTGLSGGKAVMKYFFGLKLAWGGMEEFAVTATSIGEGDGPLLAYTTLVRPILEYWAACWDPYRECQISALDRVQNKAAKFVHQLGGSYWESYVQRRKLAGMCTLYKVYTSERA